MLSALTTLLVFQLIGEVLVRGLDLPVPGPVLGMALLFLRLCWQGRADPHLQGTAQGLLQHLSLLFVPAGTGVMLHFSRVADEWLPLLVALIGSTLLSMAVTALVMHWVARLQAASMEHRE